MEWNGMELEWNGDRRWNHGRCVEWWCDMAGWELGTLQHPTAALLGLRMVPRLCSVSRPVPLQASL